MNMYVKLSHYGELMKKDSTILELADVSKYFY